MTDADKAERVRVRATRFVVAAAAAGTLTGTVASAAMDSAVAGGTARHPAPCLERYDGSVEDPDWKRFAASRSPAASETASHEKPRGERYIERAAALCIARAAGLGDGDEPWHARLLYLGDDDGVVWIVTRTRRAGDGGGEHRELVVDAVAGQVLRTSSYTTRPR